MLTTAGLQVPVIPLSEVVGNIGAVAPLQTEVGIAAKTGIVFGVIAMFIEIGTAHRPAVGVKI